MPDHLEPPLELDGDGLPDDDDAVSGEAPATPRWVLDFALDLETTYFGDIDNYSKFQRTIPWHEIDDALHSAIARAPPGEAALVIMLARSLAHHGLMGPADRSYRHILEFRNHESSTVKFARTAA